MHMLEAGGEKTRVTVTMHHKKSFYNESAKLRRHLQQKLADQ